MQPRSGIAVSVARPAAAAVALIQPLARKLPCAMGVALKQMNKNKTKQKNKAKGGWTFEFQIQGEVPARGP